MRKLRDNKGAGVLELMAIFLLVALAAMAVCSIVFGFGG